MLTEIYEFTKEAVRLKLMRLGLCTRAHERPALYSRLQHLNTYIISTPHSIEQS